MPLYLGVQGNSNGDTVHEVVFTVGEMMIRVHPSSAWHRQEIHLQMINNNWGWVLSKMTDSAGNSIAQDLLAPNWQRDWQSLWAEAVTCATAHLPKKQGSWPASKDAAAHAAGRAVVYADGIPILGSVQSQSSSKNGPKSIQIPELRARAHRDGEDAVRQSKHIRILRVGAKPFLARVKKYRVQDILSVPTPISVRWVVVPVFPEDGYETDILAYLYHTDGKREMGDAWEGAF